jgi:hypothetical protein
MPSTADIYGFLEMITRKGPIILLIDDGGTLCTAIGGTYGIPFEQRRVRYEEMYEVILGVDEIAAKLPPPLWVPVRVRQVVIPVG